jgi:hypothetical protein
MSELSDYLVPASLSWEATLDKIWASNRSLVLSYNNKDMVAQHYSFLWWPVSQKWANVVTLGQLHNYFQNIFMRWYSWFN